LSAMFSRASAMLRRSSRAMSTGARTASQSSRRILLVGGATAATATAALYQSTHAEEMDESFSLLAHQVEVEQRLRALEVNLAGKTNSAFVFIKPHACKGTPGVVEALVEEKFLAAGIRITGSGEMSAETIDKNLHIDTHYGAIASKAVKLVPSELNVPDKGKADFKKMFGLSWEDALSQGLVFNAKDGATKLGVDGAGLDAKWGQLSRGKDLIKFGGGFYCGKVDGVFVMNGFYMAMRSAYTAPGEKIHWYTVSWPTDSLSWADFRGKILGATDPSTAASGSIRRAILDSYEALGLKSKPDTGDNGVHASASPFEALAERINWVGATIEGDAFGRGMIAAGASKETIMAWADDAQVEVNGETEPGKTMSVFDALEDLDADTVLDKVSRIK